MILRGTRSAAKDARSADLQVAHLRGKLALLDEFRALASSPTCTLVVRPQLSSKMLPACNLKMFKACVGRNAASDIGRELIVDSSRIRISFETKAPIDEHTMKLEQLKETGSCDMTIRIVHTNGETPDKMPAPCVPRLQASTS